MVKSFLRSFRPLQMQVYSLSMLFTWTTSCCLAAPSKADEQIVLKAMNLHDWKASRKMLDQYLVAHPNDELIVACRTRVSSNLNQPTDTIKFATRYFALKPKPVDPSVYAVRAFAYLVTNQPKKAWLDIEQARKLRPEVAETCIIRGQILDNLGQAKEALAEYSHALKLNQSRAYGARANTEFKLKMYKEAQADLLKFTANTREYEGACAHANELFRLGKYEESAKLCHGLIAQNCPLVDVHVINANALYKLGRTKEALTECDIYTKRTGNQIDTLRFWVVWSNKDWNRALSRQEAVGAKRSTGRQFGEQRDGR